MARLSANAPCPCGSGRKGKSCCGPLLAGTPAPTPEALMRSRYTAYAVGDVGHLMRTLHPDSPHRKADAREWADELRAYCALVRCDGLRVESASADGDSGRVRFFAKLSHEGRDMSFGEESRFERVGGRWLYVDGERTAEGIPEAGA